MGWGAVGQLVSESARERRDAEMGETQETAALRVPPRAVYVHS